LLVRSEKGFILAGGQSTQVKGEAMAGAGSACARIGTPSNDRTTPDRRAARGRGPSCPPGVHTQGARRGRPTIGGIVSPAASP